MVNGSFFPVKSSPSFRFPPIVRFCLAILDLENENNQINVICFAYYCQLQRRDRQVVRGTEREREMEKNDGKISENGSVFINLHVLLGRSWNSNPPSSFFLLKFAFAFLLSSNDACRLPLSFGPRHPREFETSPASLSLMPEHINIITRGQNDAITCDLNVTHLLSPFQLSPFHVKLFSTWPEINLNLSTPF